VTWTRLGTSLAGALVAGGLVLGGCGGSAPLAISASASRQLVREVEAVRADANGGDPAAAARALATLESTVGALERSGQVSGVRAASILDATRAVQADLVLVPTTTTTTTTTPPSPPRGPKHGGGDQGPGGDGHG
jgi:hypothetical protein